ncbi:hypothetical protein D9757_011974 [Collybiopsis confluens]|uniref:Aminotransferase class V domain-containing protein n=1 Tax=Collybiopsis confluens TaxID=2823264 RepID=A0A8H5GGR7_9AGAR|nr:hypothetical protein D9757_011974 [Collybiopsis confluens]
MGSSHSINNRNTRNSSAHQTAIPAEKSFDFLQSDPNPHPNSGHFRVVRRRHSSIGNTHSTPQRQLSHRRSASRILFSRLGLGCNSADVSVLSRESVSDSSDLFEDQKIRVVQLSQYSDEPPTSPSTTTFSKNSQLIPLPHSLPSHLAFYSPSTTDTRINQGDSETEAAFDAFLKQFPQYRLTWILDTLRRTDYTRLSRISSDRSSDIETYVDYMGGSLYPESLIRVHTEFLAGNVLGNTHSISGRKLKFLWHSSQLSLRHAEEARRAVLEFFGAPPPSEGIHDDSNEYMVIFTPNASGALKLVGEAYQFTKESSFVLSTDSHNSVNGIREFARRGGAKVIYLSAGSKKGKEGAFDLEEAKNALKRNKPPPGTSSLFAPTGLSNITNAKCPSLYSGSGSNDSIITLARNLGYDTLLDAAALAPTTTISLARMPVDALAVSFYKMFGFPTGVGALVIRKGFLRRLRSGRPWFAGGTVDVVQVPGRVRTMKGAGEEVEGFEDGTINYLLLPAITSGLHLLSAYLPFLPLRLNVLVNYLVAELGGVRHRDREGRLVESNTYGRGGRPVCKVLSRVPSKVLKVVGETDEDAGAVVACVFLDEFGQNLPLSFVAHSASCEGISLRTGCMCNPGGAAALLGIQESMKDVEEGGMMREGMTLKQFEEEVEREWRKRGTFSSAYAEPFGDLESEERGRTELGVVRISLGLGTDWSDVWRVVQWARRMGDMRERKAMWRRWIERTQASAGQPEDEHEWQEVEGGAIRRRDAVSCAPCDKGVHDGSLACVRPVSVGESVGGWSSIGRAL